MKPHCASLDAEPEKFLDCTALTRCLLSGIRIIACDAMAISPVCSDIANRTEAILELEGMRDRCAVTDGPRRIDYHDS
jgi:hypothetical protein